MATKTFELVKKVNGLFLTVYQKTDKAIIINELNRLGVKNYNAITVSTHASNPSGEPIKIANIVEINNTIKLPEMSVEVSSDKFSATIKFNKTDDDIHSIPINEIRKVIVNNKISFGIIQEELEKLSNRIVYDKPIVIAKGQKPGNGKDGEIFYHINVNIHQKPTIDNKGNVDFRELGLIENVIAGQKLAELLPPTAGSQGTNVYGESVNGKPGKAAKFKIGKDVELRNNDTEIYAVANGLVMLIGKKISVLSTYEVEGNVDNSTGNIEFIGNVVVKGSVLSGFSIHAQGMVQVDGVVEAALIKAEGDIILKGGMQGKGKGRLISGGDIIGKYIENSIVEAENDIKADAIMHSSVRSGNSVIVLGNKGLIVGGTIRTTNGIEANNIGSVMSTKTLLELGVDPQLRERYKEIKSQMITVRSSNEKSTQAIRILMKMHETGGLTKDKMLILQKSLKTQKMLTEKLEELNEEFEEIEKILQEGKLATIKVKGNLFSGVSITIGPAINVVRVKHQNCIVRSDGVDVLIGEMQA